ncbi:hypothetical protein [Streptomyces sp. SAI-127]|uniref:hypothetical protein n=1 Tax=Streptomyces sp. SAI-127 TaxID=2940543 RepID=UPI0024739B60|nr:hypothetical protein [Streptomyces sp. SAI-127]MDH6489582.1 hypothetical protein [Streptomyces sp. SAI-127]
MLEVYGRVVNAVFAVVETVPYWGPVLFVGAVAALVCAHRPAGRAVSGHVPGDVRTCADTDPDADTPSAVTCADTCPDVSADTRADTSGRDARGER